MGKIQKIMAVKKVIYEIVVRYCSVCVLHHSFDSSRQFAAAVVVFFFPETFLTGQDD